MLILAIVLSDLGVGYLCGLISQLRSILWGVGGGICGVGY